jgi:NAD(P)-dependent dehydrogenase (short-subunit alcohol dehydrogenase family)
MAFGFESTTDDVIDGIDLTGKRAIVTGASGGLGEETARALASKGAAVTLTARDIPKGEAAAAKIRESTGNPNVDVRALELADLASIRAFAEGFLADHDSLNLLINNAGIMACPLMRTDAGWEMQFATNHVGHFLLTCLLAPALKVGAPARIVNLSSAGHHFGPVDFDDPFFDNREYDKWSAYGQAKSANSLFSVGLEQRLSTAGVHATAVHPGGIMTELGRHLTEEDIAAMVSRAGVDDPEAFQAGFKSIPQGAATSVWAATSADLEGRGGLYLEDCHVAESGGGGLREGGHAEWALDPAGAEKLWTLSEELVGEKFPLN